MKFFSAPVWSSGFRPFFFLATVYGPFVLLTWIFNYTGYIEWPVAVKMTINWHQHEMIFGFTMVVIAGIALTALPSWANSKDICGAKLALLAAAWIIGRLVMWSGELLPIIWIIVSDQLFIVLITIMVSPALLQAKNRWYLTLFPIMASFFIGNLLYHLGEINHDIEQQRSGLTLGLYGIIVFYAIVGGILTRVFTGNVLRQSDQQQPALSVPVELLAIGSIVLLAAVDLLEVNSFWVAIAATIAAVFNLIRLLRWHPYRSGNYPLIWILHLAFSWLVICFALKALSEFQLISSSTSWVHAFTIGALGLKHLGLMTRVALRHTGRPLQPHRLMVGAFLMMFAAACCRVATALFSLGNSVLLLSAILWAAPFFIFLALYGYMLLSPSLPKQNRAVKEIPGAC